MSDARSERLEMLADSLRGVAESTVAQSKGGQHVGVPKMPPYTARWLLREIREHLSDADGKELPKRTPVEQAAAVVSDALVTMTPDDRLAMLQLLSEPYCRHCGGPSGCQCWNDE